MVGDTVSDLCLRILNDNLDAACVNQTRITLIPKIDNPTLVSQFKPISLCNVLYKILAKCLAIRLKLVLEMVISKNQSAFVGERQTFDNAIVGYECMHTLRSKKPCPAGYMGFKLDMSKAMIGLSGLS